MVGAQRLIKIFSSQGRESDTSGYIKIKSH